MCAMLICAGIYLIHGTDNMIEATTTAVIVNTLKCKYNDVICK